jgi:RNA polymerase sigma-70 factor (ECF subfamily)
VLRRRGKADDLSRLYRQHVAAVYGFFAYSLRDAAAEDLTSATFERVLRSWDAYDPRKGSERGWILVIARNLLVDHYRRQSHRDAVSTDQHPVLLEGLTAADEPLERVLDADQLRGWLAVLGEREREILALRYAADLPAAEIAEILGLSGANVHQILSRSLRRLREAAGVTSSA